MARFEITVSEGDLTAFAVEEHPSVDAARISALRSVILVLSEALLEDRDGVASCTVKDADRPDGGFTFGIEAALRTAH